MPLHHNWHHEQAFSTARKVKNPFAPDLNRAFQHGMSRSSNSWYHKIYEKIPCL